MGSRRSKRIVEVLKQAISSIIVHELSDPRIGFVTVTKVELAEDSKTAKVYVSILGEKSKEKTSIYGLQNARKHIQGILVRRLKIRFIPVLSFHIDDSLKKMDHINQLIESVSTDKGVENEITDEDAENESVDEDAESVNLDEDVELN